MKALSFRSFWEFLAWCALLVRLRVGEYLLRHAVKSRSMYRAMSIFQGALRAEWYFRARARRGVVCRDLPLFGRVTVAKILSPFQRAGRGLRCF